MEDLPFEPDCLFSQKTDESLHSLKVLRTILHSLRIYIPVPRGNTQGNLISLDQHHSSSFTKEDINCHESVRGFSKTRVFLPLPFLSICNYPSRSTFGRTFKRRKSTQVPGPSASEICYDGCLSQFSHVWWRITVDKWVLNTGHFGYTVEFLSPPRPKPPSLPLLKILLSKVRRLPTSMESH